MINFLIVGLIIIVFILIYLFRQTRLKLKKLAQRQDPKYSPNQFKEQIRKQQREINRLNIQLRSERKRRR